MATAPRNAREALQERPDDMDILLEAESVAKSYKMGRHALKVLTHASLSVRRGEFLAIMGASGSGKSTLLHILGALDTPDAGRVTFQGKNVFAQPGSRRDVMRNRDVGFVFQFYHLLPELNVFENTLLPQMVRHSLGGWFKHRAEARRRVQEVLEQVGLSERLKHRPAELSGGERQRVAIARALINRPALLLADEPTGNLDEKTGRGILEALTRLNEQGQTIIMVTHDTNVASRAHRRVHLKGGVLTPHRPEDDG